MTSTTFASLKRGDIIRLGSADFEVLFVAEEFGTSRIFLTLEAWQGEDEIVRHLVRDAHTPVQQVDLSDCVSAGV